MHPLLAESALGRAAGGLDDQRVEMPHGKLRALQRALVLKHDVAGDENLPLLVMNFDRRRARDMARAMKRDLDLVFPAAKHLRSSEGQPDKPADETVHLVMREQRVARNVVLLFLLLLHVRGIVQHLLDQHAARLGEQHRRLRVLAHHDGQPADVIEMAVRDDDEIELDAPQQVEIRQGAQSGRLGVQAGVDEDIQRPDLQ